jgi:hypothetical protein
MMDRARVGLRDAWSQLRAKFTVGPVIVVLVAFFTLAVTGTSTWWSAGAWAIAIVAVIAFYIGRGLCGFNGLWRREFLPQPGGRVQLTLHYRGSVADRLTVQARRECRCIVHDPRGVRYYSTHVFGGGSEWYLIYPDNLAYPGSARQQKVATRLGLDVRPAPKVTGGVYRVSWYERITTHSGPVSWRLMDVGEFHGTDAI